MNLRIIAAILVMLLTSLSTTTRSLANSLSHSSDSDVIELKLSDLRSAYLLRDGVVRYDASANSPNEIRAQLQRHFDVVIGLLLVSTPRSIEAASARLEAADDHTWSTTERSSWQQKLVAMRYIQLRRLAAYRDRGLFPLNEGQSSQPEPIFVDDHDTACAVGHLMRLSGWQAEVADTRSHNNLVYVTDAPDSQIATWILTSGLTFEEAALIQPGYGNPYTPYLTSDYEPGELSLVNNGLKFENFRIEAQNFQTLPLLFEQLFHSLSGTESFLQPISGGPVPDFSNIGFNPSTGSVTSIPPIVFYTPVGSNWIVIGGQTGQFPTPGFRVLGATSDPNYMQRVRVRFDVSTTNPGTYFSQFAEHSYPRLGGFDPTDGSDISNTHWDFSTTVQEASTILGTVHLQEDRSLVNFDTRVASLNLGTQPTKLAVTSTIWLGRGAKVNSFVLGFQVVPEPTSFALAFGGLTLLLSAGPRRFRNRVSLS